MVFIGPARPKSFRGAMGVVEKHQNGPEPFGPVKHEVNGALGFETGNSRFEPKIFSHETGGPVCLGF